MRANGDPKSRAGKGGIHVRGQEEVLAARDVRELVGEHDGVEVPPRIERPDGIRVVRPGFVAGNVTLLRPGGAAVE